MQTFVVLFNTKKLTKPVADIEYKRSGDYDKQTKSLRSQTKTMSMAIEAFKKRLGDAAKHPKIAPLLAECAKHEKIAADGCFRLDASQEGVQQKDHRGEEGHQVTPPASS